jgi:hypothetical protein
MKNQKQSRELRPDLGGALRFVPRLSHSAKQPGGFVRYIVRRHGVPLAAVELPAGTLVAGRLEPMPAYGAIDRIVRRATESFLELGIFGAATLDSPPMTASARLHRWTMRRAAALDLELVDSNGTVVNTRFVNLLGSSTDAGVVVVACFGELGAGHELARSPSRDSFSARRAGRRPSAGRTEST